MSLIRTRYFPFKWEFVLKKSVRGPVTDAGIVTIRKQNASLFSPFFTGNPLVQVNYFDMVIMDSVFHETFESLPVFFFNGSPAKGCGIGGRSRVPAAHIALCNICCKALSQGVNR